MIVPTFKQNTDIVVYLLLALLLLESCKGGNLPEFNIETQKNEISLERTTIVSIDRPISNNSASLDVVQGTNYGKSITDSSSVQLECGQISLPFSKQNLPATKKQGEDIPDKFAHKKHTISHTKEEGLLYKQYITGIRYYNVKDYQKAYECLEEAAKQGYSKAQYKIGIMYRNGEYVKKDATIALDYFKKAAEQGDKYAKESLWLLKDTLKEEKIRKNRTIAEHNYKLGMHFYYDDEEKDEVKAAECFTIAAKKGHNKAQYELGLLFFKGEGISKNNQKAMKWLGKASRQGNRDATNKLNILTLLMRLDINSPQDAWIKLFANIDAYMYWHLILADPHNINISINSDKLKHDIFYNIEIPDNIMAGIFHYINCHQLSIQSLHLQGKDIKFTPYTNQFTSVEKLSITFNNLNKLPSCINTLTRLKRLDLSNNNFEHYPINIQHLITLRELDVSCNKITSLPLSISSLSNLEKLSLHNNRINSIPNSVAKLAHLCELDVSNNQLQTFPSTILNNDTNIKINLDHNPWLTINELCPISIVAARNIIYSKLPYSLRTLCANAILSHIQKNKKSYPDSHSFIKFRSKEIWKGVVKKLSLWTEAPQLTKFNFVKEYLYARLPQELWPENLSILIQEECEEKTCSLIVFFKKIKDQKIPIYLSSIMCTSSGIDYAFEQYKKKNLTFFTTISEK